jgi:predicted alpha/beta hydrolase
LQLALHGKQFAIVQIMSPNLERKLVRFDTVDGVPLCGQWYLPPADLHASAVAVIACGGGIPAKLYQRMAQYLAKQGITVLTFDYRGIGESRTGSLRGFDAGIEKWGRMDFGAALTIAIKTFPDLPLAVIAHSIGTLMVGAAPLAERISRLVLLAPHTGYWRDYSPRGRFALFLTWHVLMPMVTKIVGYFPGRALRLGEDLPRGFAMDWARRLQPELLVSDEDRNRFGTILSQYDKIRCPTLAISIEDDAFAPARAAARLLHSYPGISAIFETVTPAELGVRRFGHIGFFRRRTGEFFWKRIAAWILQENAEAGIVGDSQSLVVANLDISEGKASAWPAGQ